MSSISQITLSELPVSLQNQIPFSIRNYKDIYNLSELPTSIRYLIEKYYDQKVPEIEYLELLDVKFEISSYSDLEIYNSPKELVLDYFKRYLVLKLGSYPYDVLFGSYLKEQLQTRDTSLRQTLISNEIAQIAGVLGKDFNLQIIVKTYDIVPIKHYDHTSYSIRLQVEIEGEEYIVDSE